MTKMKIRVLQFTINALRFTVEGFNEICSEIFDNGTRIKVERDGWHWESDGEIDMDDITERLELEFGREISAFRMEDIIVDTENDKVIVCYK